MADQKVSDLPSLNGSAVDPADLLYIVDSSAGTAGSKKITIGQFQLSPYSGGVINGVTYFDGTKVLASSSALVFDGTNLGVGTSSPAQIVDISKAQNAATILAIRNSNAGATASVGLVGNADTAVGRFNVYSSGAAGGLANCVSIEQSTANPILFYQNGSESMRLDASGNLGVGTSSPQAKLHVTNTSTTSGSLSLASPVGGAGGSYIIMGNANSGGTAGPSVVLASNRNLQFGVGDSFTSDTGGAFTEYMRLDSSGNLGVGTSSPGYKLDVASADTTASYGYAMRLRSNSTATAAALQFSTSNVSAQNAVIAATDAGLLTLQADGVSSAIAFRTTGNERMRLDSSGNLGVGTPTPVSKLSVYGGGAGTDTRLTVGNLTSALQLGVDSSSNAVVAMVSNNAMAFYTNNTERARFASTGEFTISAGAQTTPVAVTFSATAMTVNCRLSNVFTTTFTANVTTAPTISNPQDGQTINWFITQDGTGGRTMTWPASFKWPSGFSTTLSTAANAVDLVTATYRSATGFWYASLLKDFA